MTESSVKLDRSVKRWKSVVFVPANSWTEPIISPANARGIAVCTFFLCVYGRLSIRNSGQAFDDGTMRARHRCDKCEDAIDGIESRSCFTFVPASSSMV